MPHRLYDKRILQKGLESESYGSGLSKIHCIDIDFISKTRNERSTKNNKEVVDNYSFTHTKYSNELFNIIENKRHFKKQRSIQYTIVLYKTLILAIKVKYLQEVIN